MHISFKINMLVKFQLHELYHHRKKKLPEGCFSLLPITHIKKILVIILMP